MGRSPKILFLRTTSMAVTFGLMGTVYTALGCYLYPQSNKDIHSMGGGLLVLGIGALIVAAGFLATDFYNRCRAKFLKQKYRYVWGKIIKIGTNYIRTNRHNPQYVIVEYRSPQGTYYTFRSNWVTTPLDQTMVGKYVRVYVHPHNHQQYHVDLDRVLGAAPELS